MTDASIVVITTVSQYPRPKKGAGFNSKHLSCVTEASLQWKQFQQSDVMLWILVVTEYLEGKGCSIFKAGPKVCK